jgi:tRNA nucleotidyltransferase (CCA-adding enzyme)
MDLSLPPLERLASALQAILTQAAQQAADRGWHLYLVGGGVRDLLLAPATGSIALQDLDLVVDGNLQAAAAGSGVELAKLLQALHPQARLEIHEKFQTAAVFWTQDPVLGDLAMDIATARTEVYPYPAANPVVAASSIHDDLRRRDFTINALALQLTPPAGRLLDQFGGQADLQQRQLRVLHAESFVEDPTRMYRGARLAARLGLHFEAQTEEQARSALASGIYEQVRAQAGQPVPALQTRLRAELRLLLQSPDWQAALRLLAQLGALRCIHPALTLTPTVERQLRLAQRWQRARRQPPAWEGMLELLIVNLDPEDCRSVCQELQLGRESADRLAQLPALEATFNRLLNHFNLGCDLNHTYPRPSQIVALLRPYSEPLLSLLAVRSDRVGRRLIWRYQSHWAQVKPLLDGNDLKALGYAPGQHYKQILGELLNLGLDGAVADRAAAIEYVQNHYSTL